MSSYKKYLMMGVTAVLLPLAKLALKKMMSNYTKEADYDSVAEESKEFTPTHRPRHAYGFGEGREDLLCAYHKENYPCRLREKPFRAYKELDGL